MADYYRILEVHEKASAEVIEKAYRALSLKYHPDRNLDRQEWATKKMRELNEAYETLSDSYRRSVYDRSPSSHSKRSTVTAETIGGGAGRLLGGLAASLGAKSGVDLARILWDRGILGVAENAVKNDGGKPGS